MTITKTKLIPIFAVAALASPALADPAPTHQLDVEIVDRDQNKHESAAHLALFVRDGNNAAVESRVGDDLYKLRVSPHGTWIEISLERRGPRGTADLTIQTVREVATGTRAVLAEVDAPDGGRTEVSLTVK